MKTRDKSVQHGISVTFLLILLALGGCATLPANNNRSHSTVLQGDWSNNKTLSIADSVVEIPPDKSGVYLLTTGLDAFAARGALIKMARVGLDIQYYLLHNDLTGQLLIHEIAKAADRGVRIRLLLDDMGLSGRDMGFVTLDSHPNIEIRIFNPFSRNVSRTSQLISRFGSVTRRMHNKSITADNVLSIVGGRNIGNEYFSANPVVNFGDLDVLVAGKVVPEISRSFDEYWNSPYSYPVTTLIGDEITISYSELHNKLANIYQDAAQSEYARALGSTNLVRKVEEASLQFDWVDAKLYSDPPSKISQPKDAGPVSLLTDVGKHLNQTRQELLIVSPYFVPGKNGVAFLKALVDKGVRVRILTNSLASNDVAVVHSGYAKYRKPLLRAGVELYEFDSSAVSGDVRSTKKGSQASLHAKSFIMDREKIFIGSLNLDPRSVYENTEIGLVFTSPTYGQLIGQQFDRDILPHTFSLKLVDNRIQWVIGEGDAERIYSVEPYTSFWSRFGVWLMSLLPIESQL
ncbi:MAG: phospholipase D family protein [Desulforhopalus sp.]